MFGDGPLPNGNLAVLDLVFTISFFRNNCSKILFELTFLHRVGALKSPVSIAISFFVFLLNLSNLARRCPTPDDIPVATLNQWHQEFDAMIQSVSRIVEKLRAQKDRELWFKRVHLSLCFS